ncbi:MAG: TetR/AcrR family transcriptional regulator, partial [Proteobacteria bacterium]|nr:TetR/AcrR family transcriptional regulator [Pseudomonadota bacterium]
KASKLFIKKGYSQTSMRDIANATGINLGNLYHYISGKEDILCIAFNNYHNLIMEFVIKNDILNIKEPKAKLKAVLRQSLEITYDFRNDLLMMYRETRVLPRKFLKIILKKEGEFVKLFEDIIAKGVESQAFKVSDPFFAANMLVFQISLYALRSWNLKQFTREEFLDMTEETILRAIIPDTL